MYVLQNVATMAKTEFYQWPALTNWKNMDIQDVLWIFIKELSE